MCLCPYVWAGCLFIKNEDEGKKKVPLIPFLATTMSLTAAKATLMNMRTEEAERTLQELATAQQQETEKQDNG